MLNLPLRLHPDSVSPVTNIAVTVARSETNRLTLTYAISGALDHVSFPAPEKAGRADELCKHSCFEIFVSAEHGYYEFNFSPSSQWAAYRFDNYREGMRNALTADPVIAWTLEKEAARLVVTLPLPADVTGPFGLSSVIEDRDGYKSYWALAHPPGAPDFHDPACFAAQLPPAG